MPAFLTQLGNSDGDCGLVVEDLLAGLAL